MAERRRRKKVEPQDGQESRGREAATRQEASDLLEVRDGDRLTVTFNGVKLQIAPYSTVELDGAIYSRTLLPGDDAVAQWDRIYRFLRDNAIKEARRKLADFSDELAAARKRAQ